mgnify:CR=1 FL=1
MCGARLDWLCSFPPLGNSVIIWAPASVSVSAGGDNRLWFYLPLLLCTFPLNKKSRGSSADKKGKYEEHSFTFYSDSSSSSPSSSSPSCKFFSGDREKEKRRKSNWSCWPVCSEKWTSWKHTPKVVLFFAKTFGSKNKNRCPLSALFAVIFVYASQC